MTKRILYPITRGYSMLCRSHNHNVFTTTCLASAGNHAAFNCLSPCLFFFISNISEDTIHLLQRLSTGLWYEKICPNKGQEAEDGEKGISSKFSILDKWRSDQSLTEVISIRFAQWRDP